MNLSPEILKTYLKRLTNLSVRNKSLLLSNLPSEQFLDLHELDFLNGSSSFQTVKNIIAQKKSVKLCDVLDPRSEKTNNLSKIIRKIARTEQFIKDESGHQDLYVGYPFVRGKFADGTVVHAPLVFFPVTILQKENYWSLQQRDESISFNRSFLLAYSHFGQTKINDSLLELALEDFGTDDLVFRTKLYETLRDNAIGLHFNQDIFQDKLQFFDSSKKTDLELLEQNGELKLYPEAVLGVFPQSGSYLGGDYEGLLAPQAAPDGGAFFSPLPIGEGLGLVSSLKEEHLYTPLPQDASQEAALRVIKSGQSVVVQGPPGTGKSQLIANLMADFAARGKRVLLVSHKRVVLDVVYERLKKIEIAPFLALVHDFKNDRPQLYRQIQRQIEEVEDYKKQNYSLDSVLLERQFLQASRTIDQISEELTAFKKALFDESDAGWSAKELYLTSYLDQQQIDLQPFFRFFDRQKSADFTRKITQLNQYSAHIGKNHWWNNRVSFATFGFDELRILKKTVAEVPNFGEKWSEKFKNIFSQNIDFQDIEKLKLLEKTIKKVLEEINTDLKFRYFQQKGKKALEALEKLKKQVEMLESAGLEKSLADDELELWQTKIEQIITKRSSVLGNLSWSLFSSKEPKLLQILNANGLDDSLAGLQRLAFLVDNKLKMRVLHASPLREGDKIEETPLPTGEGLGRFDVSMGLNALKLRNEAEKILSWDYILEQCDSLEDFIAKLQSTQRLLIEIEQKHSDWQRWLLPSQILELAPMLPPVPVSPQALMLAMPVETQAQEAIISSLDNDFDMLVEIDRMLETMTAHERAVWELLKNVEAPDEVFQNSIRLAWLRYLEQKNPCLKMVSSLKMKQLEAEFIENITLKQQLSKEILNQRLREQTYNDLEINRLKNVVTYRELSHQVTKKKRIWPLRKLMENHSEEVFRLIPCWLISPETASAVFPLVQGLFDLVIFDEASQCFVEHGIPALYRGKQVVIAGDSQQLRPNDLYRIRFDENTDTENPALEVESLLDLAIQYWPQMGLTGHYRSRSLALIAFSNEHFYQNKLKLLPHFDDLNAQTQAIDYLNVGGIWQNNVNKTEAEKVVALTQKLRIENPEKSIGIVTFNYFQQQLIQELLDCDLNDQLFVKNIENVQGDERDIIIFSIGYGPDITGKIRHNFGLLNAAGGENRLNVAVTRAREKIYVVTSIEPQQLNVENATHNGAKLLKEYLQYAKNVSEGSFKIIPSNTKRFENEWFLKSKIAKTATNTTTEIPFADLTIVENGICKSLILTDDELYYESISAKEVHAYLPIQLENNHWTFQRFWSREWWKKTTSVH